MLLYFFLLFFLCVHTAVKSQSTTLSERTSFPVTTSTVGDVLPPLQLVAIPDYPVAEGQTVNLHCRAIKMSASLSWSWQRLENQTWSVVSNGSVLTLTKPQESGVYSCFAKNQFSQRTVSVNHTVVIISMLPTVWDNLGIAAFVFSLLALIINVAILCWLAWQRFSSATLNLTSTVAKGFPEPEKAPKGRFPQSEGDGDVYINYSSTSQPYTDLDPANMTVDNVYSTLS
ncbi:uncharacterized protein LOC113148310 [Anabas testudineus]|uniref:uncharacterized protein LOC113148310 n=1 Tax=Anabas testudineus TaxID=64144 RepID=UPI000E461708|nr:uncharacterized protein LOC113148310 [Anabas testudineus]